MEQGENVASGKFIAAVEKTKFDDERQSGYFAVGHLNELGDSSSGASRGQNIVDNQHVLTSLNGVSVHFESVSAVFQRVFDRMDLVRKLFRFAYRHETSTESVGHGRGEEVAARLNADDDIDRMLAIMILQGVYGFTESGFVFEERSNVEEVDAGLGEIRDFPDE